jgi:hypothetical protein
MYQFSLDYFIAIVRSVLQSYRSAEKESLETRMENLVYSLLQDTYKRAARSLFNADRLALALNLVRAQFGSSFLDGEWEHFTGVITNTTDDIPKVPSWVPEKRSSVFGHLLVSFFFAGYTCIC